MQPTHASVLESFAECDAIGEDGFVEKYAGGRRPKSHYIIHEGKHYPLKAIWAAAHRPTIVTREFDTDKARRGFAALGFDGFWPKRNPPN